MNPLLRCCIVVFAVTLAWLGLAAQVQASDGHTRSASCTSGKGCVCSKNSIPIEEWEFIMDKKAPDGAENMILVFPRDGDSIYWTAASTAQLHRTYGGRGACPIELFFEDYPADGIWEFTEQPADLSKCPLLTSGAGGMALPEALGPDAQPVMGRKEIRWGGSFDVRKYMHPASHSYWHQVDDDNWEMRLPGLDQIPANAPVTIKARWRSTLASSTRINAYFRYISRFEIPGAGAILANLQCDMTRTHTGRWIGPLPGEPDPRQDREVEY